MNSTLIWGILSIGAAALGFYTALGSNGWPRWLLLVGSGIMLLGGLWQAGKVVRNK